jgi:hypothetical protein
MIELEDLKNIWKDNIDSNIDRQRLEQDKIRELLSQQSASIIDKLRRNLQLEIVMFFICLVLIASVPFYFSNKEVTLLCAVVLVFIFIPYFIYYIKKYLEIKRFYSYHQDIKTSLKQVIAQMEKYLNIYFWGSLLLTPVSGFISGLAILYEMKALGFLVYFDAFSSGTLSVVLSFALLLTLISYPVMKWYIRKLYGQHLEKLKSCLKELEETA